MARPAPSVAGAPALGRRLVLGEAWPELLAAAIVLAAWWALAGIPVTHDVVWQLWIARQLLGGTHLYSQIVEVNPPLWYWMAVPIQWASDVTGIAASRLMIGAVFGYAAVATQLLALILRDEAPRDRAVLLVTMVAVSVVMPLAPFGQREQECLIGAIPYIALAARRAEGRAVAWPLAFAVGLLAAPAFALKHYFILAPAAIEAWLLWTQRRHWRPLRPETLALAGSAALYAAAVVAWTPEYLSVVVPMLTAAYGGYGNPIEWFLHEPFIWVWAATGIVVVFYRRRMSALTSVAVVAAVAFGAAFVLQHKWWDYQALPLEGTLAFAAATFATGRPARLRDGMAGSLAAAACAALAVAVGVLQGPYKSEPAAYIDRLLAQAKPGATVMILTPFGTRTWPMVDAGGFAWPSRYFGLWQWPAIATAEAAGGEPDPTLAALGDSVRRATVADLECNPPALMIVDESAVPDGRRAIDYLNESADFRTIFGSYMRTGSAAIFTAYAQVAPLPPPADPDACRTIY